MVPIELVYVTDPADPASWGLEPALCGLPDDVPVRLVMAGVAREADPPALLRGWLEAAATTGMPVDARLWLDDPPRSSHPVCLAVKAAAEQGRDAAYLRRARIATAVGRRRLDAPEALVALAAEVPGLDVARFRIDLGSSAVVEAFGADLERAGGGAVPRFEDAEGGVVDPAALPRRAPEPDVVAALRRFGPLAVPEVAAVCDLPGPRAPAELWAHAVAWRAREERGLWSAT